MRELNELTGNDWSEEEYKEFCVEFDCTLEETVYALLHDGMYPDNVETNIYFWKGDEPSELPDIQIMQKLRTITENVDDGFINYFADLPVKEFFEWLRNYYSDWNINKELSDKEIATNSFKVTFSYDKIAEEEYGKCKYTMLKVYNSKVLHLLMRISFKYLKNKRIFC